MSEWHVITCEYPPQIGGVSSYVASVAGGLGAAGHSVHVWCPPAREPRPAPAGVTVHGQLGRFRPGDLRNAGRLLDGFASPRHVLIQWVPHGYGYRSMNLPFCLWVRRRARKGDRIDLMVHEPFLSFDGSWKQKAAAVVHRVMTVMLLDAARRVWISTPAWRRSLKPFARGRQASFGWLPIPSPVEPVDDPGGVADIRSRYAAPGDHVVGHFGLYSRLTARPMKNVVLQLLARLEGVVVVLMGEGSPALREQILHDEPRLATRVHATGVLAPPDLSRHLQACDVLVQPYPEGITSRRTSTMAPLAHGRAIVTTTGPSSEPVWRERGAVSLVRPDPSALVDEVARLVGDPCARAQLGARARQLYDDLFDVRHTVNALMAG
ncbi:MAG TPA: glycosyltransferase family 4 protein [Vicinamibacterales bacterium]|nr:glycosyltransferase family 4 protein [Vicinamibacterales bacterium]